MSKLDILIENTKKYPAGNFPTHSAYICSCMGVATKNSLYLLDQRISVLRKNQYLLSTFRKSLVNKTWEKLDVSEPVA